MVKYHLDLVYLGRIAIQRCILIVQDLVFVRFYNVGEHYDVYGHF